MALFLLVVVALLSVYMISLRSVQQQTLVYGVQGARAMQAARTGLEWGIYRSLAANACPAAGLVFTLPDATLSAFTITVGCTSSAHVEGATTINTFQLRAVAQTNAIAFGSLDFVSRQLDASVSRQPP